MEAASRASIVAVRGESARYLEIQLVGSSLTEFGLGGIEVRAIALGVDERVHWILRSSARDEFAVPGPPSGVARHPDIGRQAAEHANAALAVGRLFRIL